MNFKTRMRILFVGAAIGVFLIAAETVADNPIITHKYTADPNALVFDDRVYIYCSHDLDTQAGYNMFDYVLVSSKDLVNWTDHGEVFDAKQDTSWANLAYAPAVVSRDGKFYL